MRQEECEFEASLSCLSKKKKKRWKMGGSREEGRKDEAGEEKVMNIAETLKTKLCSSWWICLFFSSQNFKEI